MSDYSYTAYTIIGCEIDEDKLYEDVEFIEDNHKCKGYRELREMGREPKFCMDCGAAVSRIERRCKVVNYQKLDTIRGFRVFHVLGDRTFVAAHYTCVNPPSSLGGAARCSTNALVLKELREGLRDALEPLGVWDEKLYGVWTVLDAIRET